MVDIGITQPIVLPLPTPTTQAGQGSQAVQIKSQSIPAAPIAPPSSSSPDQVAYDAQAVKQKRVDAVKVASQQAANTFAVSDQEFTLFKDATGQYITRYTSLRDGKVTYIPEPALYQLGGPTGSSSEPLVQIKA